MPTGKGLEHPVSARQERWARAAEARGELKKGTASRWGRRAKNRQARTGQRYGRRR